ncbi:acyl carrier protein [Oxalobacteraceae bacterium OM1]|nr:acyl carrier protein [Oxalobacteraceae bacterium OM1]
MNRNDIENTLLKVLSAVLKREFSPGTALDRSSINEWDSLKHVEIMFAVEDEFSVSFTEEELAELDNVERIVNAVLNKA